MNIKLKSDEDFTITTKTGSVVTVPSPISDATLATTADLAAAVFEPGSGAFSAKQKQSVEDANVADGEAAFAGGAGSKALGKAAFAFGDHAASIGGNAYATGKNTFAGIYGWYYKYVDLTTGTFYLTTEQPDVRKISDMGPEPEVDPDFESGFEVGDVISYVNKNKRDLYAAVVSVEGNKVVVGQLDDAEYELEEEHPNHDDWGIFVPEKPTIGDIWFGEASFAEGLDTKAINAYTHTEGRGTLAYGQYGHAEGKKTRAAYASHAEGADTKADGQYSHAEGGVFKDTTTGISTATTASGSKSHAEGEGSLASGQAAHSEGRLTKATADISHAEGNKTEATGNNSHAEGYETVASGAASHSEGVSTIAGIETVAKTASSDTADGKFTHAEGNGTLAHGNSSHAEGKSSISNGRNSHAEGANTKTDGVASHAEGYQTRTQNRNEHAEGSFNRSNKASDNYGNAGNTLHSVGYGTSESNRKNALEIMQDGKVYITGVGGYDGANPTASGVKDVATLLQLLSDSMNQVAQLTQRVASMEQDMSNIRQSLQSAMN